MAERRRSDHGTASNNAPFLSPESAQGSTHTHPSFSSTASNQLLPSPIPPPTASSSNSHHRPQSRVSAVSGNSRGSQSEGAVRKSHSQSVSSTPHTLASSSATLSAENKERQRAARTLPRTYMQRCSRAVVAEPPGHPPRQSCIPRHMSY